LETATARASVAVVIDGVVVAEAAQSAAGNHAVSLLNLIESVLDDAGCTLSQLDAVAVSGGPGSFSGLRIGLSVAKGLAYAAGLQLVAVSTLEALARTVIDFDGVICTLLDARKGELYAACFESTGNGCQRLTGDAVVTLDSLVASIQTPCAVVGDAVDRYGAALQERLGSRVKLLPVERYAPRGGMIAMMGCERLLRGEADIVADLEPFYIRPSDAERRAL
jgi:tRNA threonylcarbamoyladenosine biosynthesis protein TsaB